MIHAKETKPIERWVLREMGIYRANSMQEIYRLRALSKDITELAGRPGGIQNTKFVLGNISKVLPILPESICVDVGCGEGSLLEMLLNKGIHPNLGKVIGICPNNEEIIRVKKHLQLEENTKHGIEILYGTSESLPFDNEIVDILICNNVLHGAGNSEMTVINSLNEFNRVLKTSKQTSSGLLYVGEIPDRDELSGKTYNNSISKWLWWTLKNQGAKVFLRSAKHLAVAIFTSEPFIIHPKTMYYASPETFSLLLSECGFEVLKCFKLLILNEEGVPVESLTRYNYIAKKTDRRKF